MTSIKKFRRFCSNLAHPIPVFYLGVLSFLLFGCLKSKTSSETQVLSNQLESSKKGVPVKVVEAKKESFPTVLFSNGQVTADQRVEIRLRTNGRIDSLPIYNGAFIEQNSLICLQESEDLYLKLEEEQLKYEQAMIKMDGLIIEQGGTANDTTSIPPKVLRNLQTKSGLKEALLGIKRTKFELKEKSIYAPISGWIVDLQLNNYQEGSKGEALCTIVNPASFKVHFTVLETNIKEIKPGTPLTFGPSSSSNLPYKATVDRIIPTVDKNGLISVVANIKAPHKELIEGMKVGVRVEKSAVNMIVIPKKARVLRNNRDVVFTADTSLQFVHWKYVTIAHENDAFLAIQEGLEEGDLVIYQNNLNLDQDSRIEIIQ